MHVDECPYATRLTRWIPVQLPVYHAFGHNLEPLHQGPVYDEWVQLIRSIIPKSDTFEIRPPSYQHSFAHASWNWHHDTFCSHQWMIVWASVDPTLFRVTNTGAMIEGIQPYDVIIADKMLTEHSGHAAPQSPRWLARAFTNHFDIQQYHSKEIKLERRNDCVMRLMDTSRL